MALERIDPILREDCYAVDHLLRYALAEKLATGKRVLDAACGSGFGTVILMHSGAAEVIGLDKSDDAIASCRKRWKLDKLAFEQMDLECIEGDRLGRFSLITTFETLEHVNQPGLVLEQFKKVLDAEGIVLGSVPGRMDLQEENAFHLQHFTQESLSQLLCGHFKHVKLYRQDFSVKSSINRIDPGSGELLSRSNENGITVDFGKAGAGEDTIIFMASDQDLPDLDTALTASSRNAWRIIHGDYLKAIKELDSFASKYAEIFQEHGDLKVKFTNMLRWGQWHYEELHGEAIEEDVMERIATATSQREVELREQVKKLHDENLSLKSQVSEFASLLAKLEGENIELFKTAAKSLEDID